MSDSKPLTSSPRVSLSSAPRQAAVSRCGSFHPGRGKWHV